MANKLDEYDANKLREALKLIKEVAEYNFLPSSSLSKKLQTVENKLQNIIDTEQEERGL